MPEKEKTQEEKKVALRATLLPGVPLIDIHQLIDIEDVIAYLRNAVTDNWAYKITFNKGTKDEKVTKGLGIVGAREVAAIIAKLSRGQHVIRALKINRLEETAETWEAEVLVGLFLIWTKPDGTMGELLLNTIVGYHGQEKMGKRKDGSTWVVNVPDKLAISKATRKGIESWIPDKWTQRIIAVAEKEKKIRDEGGEGGSSEPGTESKGNNKATEPQIAGINKRLGNKHVDGPTREHYEKAMGMGMDKWQASRAIKSLDQIIKAGEDKEKEEDKSDGQGLF